MITASIPKVISIASTSSRLLPSTSLRTMTTRGEAGLTTDDQTNVHQRRQKGEFVRGMSTARNWISSAEGSYFPPEAGRYHLYVAYNCPWCHRVLLTRSILGLEDVITVDVLFPNRSSEVEPLGAGLWKFLPEGQVGANQNYTSFPECTSDRVFDRQYVKQIYEECGIHDQKSVPILLDKQTKTIVNNESAEIMRMLITEMAQFGKRPELNLYPDDKAEEITKLNDWIYTNISNGSYKAGFSTSQEVYETAYEKYFAALEELDERLSKTKFLVGDSVTEADVRLFPTLYRHDPIYYLRFKLNQNYLRAYENIWRWMGDMMNLEGMDPVSNANYLAHCKQGYFGRTGNSTIPVGPPGYPECYKIPMKELPKNSRKRKLAEESSD